jgi:hypothetical protein
VEKTAWIPEEWETKMRIVRPDDVYVGTDPKEREEVRLKYKGYLIEEEEWENYADKHWDAAFDDAFGVSEFQAFLATIPEKINLDLNTTPTYEVMETWFEMYEQAKNFNEKNSMDHVHLYGPEYDDMIKRLRYSEKRKEIGECKKKPEIVQQLYDKVLDLQDNCEILKKLTRNDWTQNNQGIWIRYDHIRQKRILRKNDPVKMKRTSKSTPQKDKAATGGTKTTVKKKK